MKNISHLYQDPDGYWHLQYNEEHCEGVAARCCEFASEFGMAAWGRTLGLLHDRGKERSGFQAHIKYSSGYDASARSEEESSHSAAGAILAHRIKEDVFYWLSNAIAGHHRGLYDLDELEQRLTEKLPGDVDTSLPSQGLEIPCFQPSPADGNHLGRMLFSCLVDADWLDTESFMQPARHSLRVNGNEMPVLSEKLEQYCERFKDRPGTPLNRLRTKIQEICRKKGAEYPGFFELTVPTGGGKTIASVIWAVSHALHHGKHRIVIAVPFTSIIVQTAETLRAVFGDENVVEHHSAVNEDKMTERSRLACENWDAPIVVTTNVQLFESMYSNRPSVCRKLHSLCNSVVILDEAQSLPLTLLQPIVDAMRSYVKMFGTSFLFCTASQPVLDGKRKGAGPAMFLGIPCEKIHSIIPPEMGLHESLRRVSMYIERDVTDIEGLCASLSGHDRVLCVVNTRKLAYDVYSRLKATGKEVFHLSRMMCQAHILDTINGIKEALRRPEGEVRVVSTQLIEAGVDIDFPVVYRQMAGLESLLQAAGRCNREGTLEEGDVHVFQFGKEDYTPRGAIGFATDAMKEMISMHPDADWLSPAVMTQYYEMLYSKTPSFDTPGIAALLSDPMNCRYEQAARAFRIIEDNGISVIVNYGEGARLIEELKAEGPSRRLSRQLGRYAVSVPAYQFDELMKHGDVEEPAPGFYYIPFGAIYDEFTGLRTGEDICEQIFII